MDFMKGLEHAKASGIPYHQFREIWMKEMEVKRLQYAASSGDQDMGASKGNDSVYSLVSELVNQVQHLMNQQKEQFQNQQQQITQLQALQIDMNGQLATVGGYLVDQVQKMHISVSALIRIVGDALCKMNNAEAEHRALLKEKTIIPSEEFQNLKSTFVNQIMKNIDQVMQDALEKTHSTFAESFRESLDEHNTQKIECTDPKNEGSDGKYQDDDITAAKIYQRDGINASGGARKKTQIWTVKDNKSDLSQNPGMNAGNSVNERTSDVAKTSPGTEISRTIPDMRTTNLKAVTSEKLIAEFVEGVGNLLTEERKVNSENLIQLALTVIEEVSDRIQSLQTYVKNEISKTQNGIAKLNCIFENNAENVTTLQEKSQFERDWDDARLDRAEKSSEENNFLTQQVGQTRDDFEQFNRSLDVQVPEKIIENLEHSFSILNLSSAAEDGPTESINTDKNDSVSCKDEDATESYSQPTGGPQDRRLKIQFLNNDTGINEKPDDCDANVDTLMLMFLMQTMLLLFLSDVPCKKRPSPHDWSLSKENPPNAAELAGGTYALVPTPQSFKKVQNASLDSYHSSSSPIPKELEMTAARIGRLREQEDNFQSEWHLRPISGLIHHRETVCSDVLVTSGGYAFKLLASFITSGQIDFALVGVCGPRDDMLDWPVRFKVTLTLEKAKGPVSIRPDARSRYSITKTKMMNRPRLPVMKSKPYFLYIFRNMVFNRFLYNDTLTMNVMVRIKEP